MAKPIKKFIKYKIIYRCKSFHLMYVTINYKKNWSNGKGKRTKIKFLIAIKLLNKQIWQKSTFSDKRCLRTPNDFILDKTIKEVKTSLENKNHVPKASSALADFKFCYCFFRRIIRMRIFFSICTRVLLISSSSAEFLIFVMFSFVYLPWGLSCQVSYSWTFFPQFWKFHFLKGKTSIYKDI